MSNKVNNSADYGIFLNKSSNNTIYNNYFNNTNNSYDNCNNTWNITKTAGANIVGGPYLGGNYWSDYEGTDLDGDKLGDTLLPYNCSGSIQKGGDWHPLIEIPKIILKASKDGYASAQHEIDNDENFEQIEISGNVTDKSTGEPIEGAKVEIVKGANPASITTGADGTYTITAIIPEGSESDTREDINFELTPSQYIVGVHEITTEVIELIEENNGTIIDQCQYEDGPRALLVYISEEENIDDFINNVRGSPLVKYVELNRIVHASHIPDDPLYPLQWGPWNIHAGGPPDPSAWDVETGDKNIIIAIVDSGIQYNHEDLYRFNDGTVKYVYGYDWVDKDDDPSPVLTIEDHGTHCTGIATAVMDNNKGITGIAPNCSFIAERVMRTFWRSAHWGWNPYIGDWVWVQGRWVTRGSVWSVSQGIMDAADHDADVISMSFGDPEPSEFERDATLYASGCGCILVAAAGNDADLPWYAGGIAFPAAYPWVIAVGATDRSNERATFYNQDGDIIGGSQWGLQLELVAPGVDILSTVPWNSYITMDGTSMATPHVAGVAALVKSRAERWPEEPLATNPRYHLNNRQIRQVLIQSAIDLGSPGWDTEYGHGKVDAGRAVRCVNISGNVLESVFNVPIPHPPGAPFPPEVRVTSIEGPSGIYTTNENTTLARITPDGDYFVMVPPGVYSICAMAYGYIPSHGLGGERVELPAFDLMGRLNEESRGLRLVPFPCNVTGNATDNETGLPITDAFVSLDGPPHIYPPHPNVHMETETNSNGNYSFILEYGVHPPYPTGEAVYNITLSKPGYQTQTQNFTLNWSDVVKDYYKCPLDPKDYDPPILNFSLLSGPSELPDLTLARDGIQIIFNGNIATISATIHNIGGTDTSNIVVQFFDGNPDAGGTQIGTDQIIASIAHESTGTAQMTWTAVPGTHDIFVRVDPYNSIEEASE
jgi:parallel beta-helix repeat protein